nr:isoprenylcysteine carboxylmethyltransferase family protein [Candidatus Delongbacteria bacterium]
NQRRGRPIEDPELYFHSSMTMVFGHLPLLGIIIVSLVIPVTAGLPYGLGLVFYLAGIIINILAMISFAETKGGLNTGGIYRYSRNPMYVGLFLFVLGINLMGWNPGPANLMLGLLSIGWIAITHRWALKEEAFLTRKYGRSYLDFKQQIPRYIRFFGHRKPMDGPLL